jgi:acyl carrier protein
MPLDRPTAVKVTRQILARHLDRHIDSITDEKRLRDDLGADSLDPLEVALTIEDEVGISIVEEIGETEVHTVGDVMRLVEAKLA